MKKGANYAVKVGDEYGKLKVLRLIGGLSHHKKWLCQCRCGTIVQARQAFLKKESGHKCCLLCKPKRKSPANRHKIAVGDKFGNLVVEEDLGYRDGWGGRRYRCRCKCGQTRNITAYLLVRGSKNGPLKCGKFPCRPKAWNQKVVGEISGLAWAHIRNAARSREIPLSVTQKDAWNLFLQQQRKCALTGVELHFSPDWKSKDQTASFDRIDSTKGYEAGNVQWVHKTVNKMKNTLPQEEFIQWCKLIAEKSNASSAVQVA